MKKEEIIAEIHKADMEIEIYKHLSEWIINTRERYIQEMSDGYATIYVARRIAEKNTNKKEAIIGIKDLCDEYLAEYES